MGLEVNPRTGELDLVSIEDLSGYVPYTGATANVDLGDYDITTTDILFTGTKYNYNPDLTDMGVEQKSPLDGYAVDYISNKTLSNCIVGQTAPSSTGAIRMSSGAYQVYQGGVWNDVVVGFRFREDSNEDYELEHKPIGFSQYYEVASGNANYNAMNGIPFIQQYSASMGAYAIKLQIDGGTF